MNTLTLHKYNASGFTLVQNRFFDDYMISANGEFVKIYLYLLRSSTAEREISLSSIADAFNHTENDVRRALTYWEKCNLLRLSFNEEGTLTDIILTDGSSEDKQQNRLTSYADRFASAGQAEEPKLPAVEPESFSAAASIAAAAEPAEAARQITISADRKKELAQNGEIRQLMYIAEQYLGKKLSSTEVTHILYFYDELHFSSDLIEYLIEYCVSKGKRSIHYIRTVALEWASKEISTVEEAKKDTNLYSKDYYAILSAFGIKDRGPAQPETELMSHWLGDMGFSRELVLEACRRTINSTHKPSFQYADRILKSWQEKGVRKIRDLEALDAAARARSAAKPAPKPSSSGNRFNNFPQRDYDYDQLEQQLLDC